MVLHWKNHFPFPWTFAHIKLIHVNEISTEIAKKEGKMQTNARQRDSGERADLCFQKRWKSTFYCWKWWELSLTEKLLIVSICVWPMTLFALYYASFFFSPRDRISKKQFVCEERKNWMDKKRRRNKWEKREEKTEPKKNVWNSVFK